MSDSVFQPGESILLYGDAGAGKTALIGEAADYTDLRGKGRTVLFTADRGGTATIKPYVDLKIIEVRSLLLGDPWVSINAAVQGKQFDGQKWIPSSLDGIGLICFESISALAEMILLDMTKKNAEGKGIGGKAGFVIQNPDGSKLAGNTQVDYSGVQTFLTEKVWQSQLLPVPIIWTTHIRRGTDEDNSSVLGPAAAGKALTTVLPRWFTYTFRVDAIPSSPRPRHILYLEEHTEIGMKGFGNARIPLGVSLPTFRSSIEPASLTAAMEQIRSAQLAALNAVKGRRK